MDESTHPTRLTKRCPTCEQTKPCDEFYPSKRTASGLSAYCKECTRLRRRRDSQKYRARETAYTRAWREANREKHDAYMAEWRAANRDLIRQTSAAWDVANAERLADLKRAWFEANKDAVMARRRERWEEIREINRRSARKTSDRRAERERQRRTIKAGGDVSQVDLDFLWTGACGLCAEPIDRHLRWPDPLSKSLDHIQPLSLGGNHSVDNLQWTHLFCNVSKGNRVT